MGIEKEWLFMDTYRFMDTSWCFLNVKKTASNIVCLRRCNYSLSAVPLNLTFAHFFMYDHTYLIDNGFGSRQRLLWGGFGSSGIRRIFRAALKSPFSLCLHTALPPPAALCDVIHQLTSLSHRFCLVVYFSKG